jgi:hypothetical protein
MSGGTISGNQAGGNYFFDPNWINAKGDGGGVYVDTYGAGAFTKTGAPNGGTISGNHAYSISGGDGHTVYCNSGPKYRNSSAGPGDDMDSAVSGAAGGWE